MWALMGSVFNSVLDIRGGHYRLRKPRPRSAQNKQTKKETLQQVAEKQQQARA